MTKTFTEKELLRDINIIYKSLLYRYVGAIENDEEQDLLRIILDKHNLQLSEDAYYDLQNKEEITRLKKQIKILQAELDVRLKDYSEETTL